MKKIWDLFTELNDSIKIKITPFFFSKRFLCSQNVDNYINFFGGKKVEGIYVLKHNYLNIYQLIQHYVVYKEKQYIDITPFYDYNYIIFLPLKIKRRNMFVRSLDILNINVQETEELTYYVYCYIDPTTKEPFYVGKGKGSRAYVHMLKENKLNKQKTRFKNKVDNLIKNNTPPEVIFLASNIEDESIAYDIEKHFIKLYGRKDYDENGVLLNICEDATPPNHKGLSFREIYGEQRATEIIEKKRQLQLIAGGWGPKFHSKETKQKLSKISRTRTANRREQEEKNILSVGKNFCDLFNNKISQKKWKYYTKINNIKNFSQRKSFRFSGKDILKVFCENFGAVILQDSLLWFHHPFTKKTFRCLDWEYNFNIISIPEGFIRGRGRINDCKSI